ncbi:MAG: proline--tRNA ligase [Candidatus Aenigmarchaeota archaeon]|nr:proline--tRNA ligase [Candidatus Aenigmarchaeota archaeon]
MALTIIGGDDMTEKTFDIEKENFSKWYNTILKSANLIDIRYNVKGFVVYMPWAMKIIKRLYEMWERELEKTGHGPCLFPVVIPPENFEKEKEHIEGFEPEVFWITKAGKEKENLALRPTSETAFYQMYSIWIRSYNDLPFKFYQSCAVYRHETKATKPLMRGREFLWIEAHNAFETEGEALAQVKEDMKITKNVYDKLGIPFIFFQRPEFDKFAGAVSTYAADTLMPDGKILQLPSTHYLGQNFSKPFNIKFLDKNGKEKYPYQTCYGPPISRTLAALISIHGDKKGLILPFDIAPVQIVIVPIIFEKTRKKVLECAKKLKNELSGFRVEIDASEKRPGEKFYYWEMKGVPIRIEIGPKDIEKKQVILVNRVAGKKTVKEKDLLKEIKKQEKIILETMKDRANKSFNSMITEADDIGDVEKIMNKNGGFVKINFCSIGNDGRKCAEILKEKTGAEVRGIELNKKEKPKGKCIVCGKPAKCVVYAGRAY